MSNVIRLADFRASKKPQHLRTVFYIHGNEARWSPLLESLSLLKIEKISSSFELSTKLFLKKPDLILLESGLEWTNPLYIVDELHGLLEIPIVMICDSKKSPRVQAQIKQAYSVGLYDVLFTPLKKEEILETLEVLLKLQIQSSQNQ